ncbi:hypothetical protein KA005_70815 [bacterium]|nr:hypothetical protein [bacterium]
MYGELMRINVKAALKVLLELKKYMEVSHQDMDKAIVSVMNDMIVDELKKESKKVIDTLKKE